MMISWGRVKSGTWSDFERLFLQADAATQSARGLRCRWLLRDLDDADTGFAISVWNSAEDLQRYLGDASVRELRTKQFDPLFIGEYFRQPCEVRVASPGALNWLMPVVQDATVPTNDKEGDAGSGSD